jgi:hypothetical protein
MQAMMQIGDRVIQPIYGVSPKKWMQKVLEGFQIDYDDLRLTPEEEEELSAAAEQPDPRVEAANIEAQALVEVARIKDETDQLKIILDAQAKGDSLEQAREAVQTQAAANLTQEAMKQEGAKAASAPPAPPAPESEPITDTGAALEALGLQG